MSENPFPESEQKAYLRRLHLMFLARWKQELGRGLAYLGLPSAEMLDVMTWKPVLSHVTAVERDHDLALRMYRTAQELGIRERTVIIERGLAETLKLLAMDDSDARLRLTELYPSERAIFSKVRTIGHDVINLDLCGGFLYPRESGESENAELLNSFISLQTRHHNSFVLMLTLNMRDTGHDEYDRFISETLDQLVKFGIEIDDAKEYYLGTSVESQPQQLRRLRFCVPVFLQKIALNDFHVKGHRAWRYKTFYHCRMLFEPRKGRGALGLTWPPIDEFEEMLKTPLFDVREDDGEIKLVELPAPVIHRAG